MTDEEQAVLDEKVRYWTFAYNRKHANIFTLGKLVRGGVLTQEQVDKMVADRLAEFGE